MKRIVWPLLIGVVMASCSSNSNNKPLPNANVTIVDEGAKQAGLDLAALGELIKKSPNPSKLEEALNKPGSINNLDLDNDGKVDYIKVNEIAGDGNSKTLKFVDEAANGNKTEVASVSIEKGQDNQATMNMNGNPSLYGNNSSYQSGFSLGEVLLMAYLFSPHMPYYSPYGYGAYPGYYRPYSPVPMSSYRTTVTTYTSHPIGTVAKPAPASATNSRSSFSNANKSQKSFGVRNSSKPVGSGGFGSHSSGSSSSGSSYHSSSSPSYHSSGSSSHSSGGSSRSFGRSRRH